MEKIIQGDSLKIMKDLRDKSFDFILADYPFNCQDGRRDYFGFISETVEEFYRLLKFNRNLLVVNNPHNLLRTAHLYLEGFKIRNGITLLRKGALRPAWHLGFQHNYAVMFFKGELKETRWHGAKKNHQKQFETDVIEYQNGYRGKGKMWHPQALPEDFVEKIIKLLTNKGDVVLDPFLGSGTTAVVARKLGRNYLGIELNPAYIKMAEERLAQQVLI